ncbi:CHAT domain-containing protein [Fulvivirgaceae bacterium BMA12]|uniref:CHAT domain-containing protein n=1 Tax=Agaribacillus aureus TaxID=3051825 RepID=A0ABT8L3L2_9BACT|nr:CHAT domain-containing protein [Fulvivirgaceae bacterium BMA12]
MSFLFYLLFLVANPHACSTWSTVQSHNPNSQENDSLKAAEYSEIAMGYRKKRQFDSAYYFYEKAKNIYQTVSDQKLYFNQKIRMGEMLERMQLFDSAIGFFNHLEVEVDESGFFNYITSYTINQNLGMINGRARNFFESINAFKKNIPLSKNHAPNDDENALINLGRTYNNLGISYSDINSYELSNKYYDSALMNLREHYDEPTELEHVIYNNKARNYKMLGYFDEALAYFRQSESMMDQLAEGALDEVDRGLFYLSYGSFYLYKNQNSEDLAKASQFVDSSYSYFRKVNPDFYFLTYSDYNAGEIFLLEKQYESAKEKALDARRRLLKYFGPDNSELGYVSELLGRIAHERREFDLAANHYQESLTLYKRIKSESFEEFSSVYINQAKNYAAQERFSESLIATQEALKLLIPDFDPADEFTNPEEDQLFNWESMYQALETRADILMQKFSVEKETAALTSAIACYNLLINHIRLSRSDLFSLKSKSNLSARRSKLYEDAVDAAIQAYKITDDRKFLKQAFTFADNRKSNNLNERLTLQQQKIEQNIPHSWKLEETELLAKINLKEKEIHDAKSSEGQERLSALENDLFYLKQAYDQHFAQLKDQFPYYIHNRQNKSVELNQLSSQLGENEALMAYFETDSSLYLFLLTDQLDCVEIPQEEGFQDRLSQLLNSLKNNQYDKALAQSVSDIILKPAFAKLKDQGIESLLIIPDGYLNYLPFELLPPPQGATTNPKIPFLINDFTIRYHYAARLVNFFQGIGKQKEPATQFYGFAPSFSRKSNPLLATRSAENIKISSELQDLPQARAEVLYGANLLNGQSFMEDEATEENFKEVIRNAGIIHLASHAIINDEDPMYSKIVFATATGDEEDGLLYTYELYNMDMNAQLACLSACNTGFGNLQGGEGVVSLARGFMYAGVPNVMMSLWSVPDNSTAEIMKVFYEEIDLGKGKADALRTAKLKYLRRADANTSNPYYWGAITMVGDNEPIKRSISDSSENLWLWAIGTLMLVAMVGVFMGRYKK